MIASSIVDWGKLLEAAYLSAEVRNPLVIRRAIEDQGAFGIGVVLIGGLAVVASLRSQDRRRAHQSGGLALDIVTGACALAIAGAIALGIYIMASK